LPIHSGLTQEDLKYVIEAFYRSVEVRSD